MLTRSARRTQRGYAATKTIGIFPAKHVLSPAEGTRRRKVRSQKTSEPWRLGARNIPIREFPTFAKFAQTAKTLSHSSTRFFPDYAEKMRFAYRRTAATESRIISRKGAKVMNPCPSARANARDLKKISPCGRNDISSGLGVFAPLREAYPNPRVFDHRKICAS